MKNIIHHSRAGFGLVELLVGMVIGLIAVLAIIQTVSTFEQQKRTTTTGSDAQSNGAIALYTIQRWGQAAGFGLPASDPNNQPLNCTAPITYVGGSTVQTDILPFQITDGGGGASDTLVIRSDTNATSMGAPPLPIRGVAGNVITVDNNFSCNVGDIVLATTISSCAMSNVTALGNAPATITVTNAAPSAFLTSGILGCMSGWSDITYAVANDNLTEQISNLKVAATPATPTVAGIVNIQAQYGIAAAANSKPVVQWVDATAVNGYASPIPAANRVLIRAVRVAVVARSAQYEKTQVSFPCFSTTAAYSTAPATGTGVCAWEGSAANPAPTLTIANPADGTDWQRYRYRVFETIIPLRNMVWLPQP